MTLTLNEGLHRLNVFVTQYLVLAQRTPKGTFSKILKQLLKIYYFASSKKQVVSQPVIA